MGFLDTFKGNKHKTELENLKREYEALNASITPEMKDVLSLQDLKLQVQKDIDSEKESLSAVQEIISQKEQILSNLEQAISKMQQQLVCLTEEFLVQEFGLYTPQYDFANALGYKEALSTIRQHQKYLIKTNHAVNGSTTWTVNNSAAKGKKMVSDTQKLLLRAFNNECDDLVSKVKYTNFDASLDKIKKSADTISKLGATMSISITQEYIAAKEKELRLAFEYQCKKQQEKEEAKAAKQEQREQEKVQKELEAQRQKIEKEQSHYQTAYEKLKMQLSQHPDDTNILAKKEELERQLSDIDKALTDIDYRQANMRAGYVYIISNIGAFGENIYKIGMTRRLDPQERIDELGDASVPFNFDVHAMIFSDDAPALEAALHKAFEDRKVNMVNHRREFFHVTLDEIKKVVQENFDKTVEFIDTPNAEQYRISLKMRHTNQPNITEPPEISL